MVNKILTLLNYVKRHYLMVVKKVIDELFRLLQSAQELRIITGSGLRLSSEIAT